MPKHGKKYKEARKQVDREKLYSPLEALTLVKEIAPARFDETVEVSVKLGVDPRHADQQVRGTVVLPQGTGKQVTVLVLAKGEAAEDAEKAGADYVGAEDLVEKIEGGWLNFDVAIATPDMMRVMGKLGRILGPRGLMPNPKTGTVTMETGRAVKEAKAGKVEYRTDKSGNIHVPLGKVSFEVGKLLDNFQTLINAVVKARPPAAKGQYLRNITVSSSMGPGVRINPHEF